MSLRALYSLVTIAMFFALSVAFERRAYAYVDPGSGLLMLQAAGTVLTGVLFTRNNSSESPTAEGLNPESEA